MPKSKKKKSGKKKEKTEKKGKKAKKKLKTEKKKKSGKKKEEEKVNKEKKELVEKRVSVVKELASRVRDKFGKYVKCVITFESIERPGITKESPIEVLVVGDDTAVKKHKMPPETQTAMIDKIQEIGEEIDPRLKIQVVMLTKFWKLIRTGDPRMYNYIRTGLPVLDLGFFEPLKRLLMMGAIKPTQEAILRNMDASKKYMEKVQTYWEWSIERMYRAVTWSCNSFLMASGMPPADPKEMASVLKHYFVKKKDMNPKFPEILNKIVKNYKDIEHGVITEIRGELVKELCDETREFVNEMEDRIKGIVKDVQETSTTEKKVKTTPKIFWIYQDGSRGYAWLLKEHIIFAIYEETEEKRPPKLVTMMKAEVEEKELSEFKKIENKELYEHLQGTDFKPIITPSLISVVLNKIPEEFKNSIIQVGVEYPGRALLDLSPAMISKKSS